MGTMKGFIILCIVIGISAGFSVGSSAEREAAVQGAEHDLYRQKRDLAGNEDADAIAELDGVEAETGVDRFKREAKESKKKAEKGAGAKDVIHMGNWGRREAKESKKKAEKGAGAKDVIHMGNFGR